MTFQDYAAKETAAVFERLVARCSEDSIQQLRALRDALDQATRTLEAVPPPDADVRELADRLATAFADRTRRIQQQASDTVDTMRSELEAARADLGAQRLANSELASSLGDLQSESERHQDALAEARLEIDGLRGELATQRIEFSALADAFRQESANLRVSLSEERDRTLAAERDRATAAEQRQQLEGACAAANAACQLEVQVRMAAEEDLREVRALLDRSNAEAARLGTQIELAGAEKARVEAALAIAEEACSGLAATRDAAEARAARELEARVAAERELQEVQGTLDGALADVTHLAARLEASAGETGRLLTDLSAAQSELQTARAQQEGMAAQLRGYVGRIQALERSHAKQEELILQLQARVRVASQPEASTPADEARRNEESGLQVAESPAAGEVERVVSVLDASVRGIDALASASTIDDLLKILVQQLAGQFSRVALFRVKENRLAGEHQMGFDRATYVRKIMIPLGVESMLTRVATTGEIERLTGAEVRDETKGAPFRGAPAIAVAMPLAVHGETVAVVYADDAAHGGAAQDPAVYEMRIRFSTLIVRQTAVLLMRLTHELRIASELREYATTLLQGAEQMYAADAETRRAPDDRRRRLQENLECARQLYAQRASLEGTAAAGLLDEQIAALIQSRSDEPFARDLAAIVGSPYAVAAPRSAEAS